MSADARWSEWCERLYGAYEPPGPTVTLRFSLPQAVDVFEAYKASRFRRPWTSEIRQIFRAALRDATETPR